jgi:hypothetical protein
MGIGTVDATLHILVNSGDLRPKGGREAMDVKRIPRSRH